MPDSATPLLTLRLFGPFEALLNGALMPGLRRRQSRWLLALLALRAGRSSGCERAWLAGDEGDYTRARALYEEALAAARRAGHRWAMAMHLYHLGTLAILQRDYDQARGFLEESLAIQREVGGRWGIANSLSALGHVARQQREEGRAAALDKEGLLARKDLGSARGIIYSLEELAALAAMRGRPERAARLFGAADALSLAPAAVPEPVQSSDYDRIAAAARAGYDRLLAALRTALSEAAFAAAWAEGQSMSQEQAIAAALEEADDA